MTCQKIVEECVRIGFKVIAMKLPLNDRLSPYSRGYKNILKDVHQ